MFYHGNGFAKPGEHPTPHASTLGRSQEGQIKKPISERFYSHVEKTESCWLWTARCDKDGYGRFCPNREPVLAHRFSYQMEIGEIPSGLELDHLCRIRRCVNPSHLEPVTRKENVRRGLVVSLRSDHPTDRGQKPFCKHGHKYDNKNTKFYKGYQFCRKCNAIAVLKCKHKNRYEVAA